MRVLLISYHFPPSDAVGALRAAKVAEAFRAAGHEVYVVTARLPYQQPKEEPAPGLHVRTVDPLPHPREFYLRAKAKFGRSDASQAEALASPIGLSGDRTSAPRAVPFWKRYIFSAMYLPDTRQGFILPAVHRARKFLADGIDLIYTTVPPFSVHLVGLILKRSTGVRWAAEFRDPWTDNPIKYSHQRSWASDRIERWLEGRCLNRADNVICVSEGIHQVLAAKLEPRQRGKVITIRNGIDHLVPLRPPRPAGKPFGIVHVGSFYHERDPRPFLSALASLHSKRRLSGQKVVVDFVGNCRWFRGVSVEQEVERLGLGDVVRFRDWVPRSVSLELVANADLLLLLAQSQPAQVPNKLYEYLGARAPILGFVDQGGEAGRMLEYAGGHYLITDQDPDKVEDILETAIVHSSSRERQPAGEDVLVEWGTQSQMQRLLATVGVGAGGAS